MEKISECNHCFKFLRTAKKDTYSGFSTLFVRIDYFFCEKCLEQQEKKYETYSRETPMWYLGDD